MTSSQSGLVTRQPLPTSRLGSTLCFVNPKQEKLYANDCRKIEQARLRRESTIFQNQRSFFVDQFLEKGLNPCMAPMHRIDEQNEGHTELTESIPNKINHTFETRSDITTKRPLIRAATIAALRNSSEDNRTSSKKIGQPILRGKIYLSAKTTDIKENENSKQFVPMLPKIDEQTMDFNTRSKTVPDIKIQRNEPVGIVENMRLPSQPLSNVVGNKHNEDSSDKEVVSLPYISQTSKDQRSAAFLKSNPDELFPKMKNLIKNGPASVVGESLPEIPAGPTLLPRSRCPTKPRPLGSIRGATKQSLDEEELSKKYVKMIQNVTNFLPDHLIKTAREQIRMMSKTDEIYALKQSRLEENRTHFTREILVNDSRWRLLETSLCPTYGLGLPWRRVREAHWSQVPENERLKQNIAPARGFFRF